MEFGDPNTFAVQLQLDPDYGGSWLFGRFCYWINRTQVGDYALGTSLRDLFFSMKWIIHDRGNRRGSTLCKLPPHEIFLLLDSSLFGNKEPVTNLSLPDAPARFDITPRVDVFDGWQVYLVECEMHDLILYRGAGTRDQVEAFRASKGTFDAVIMQAYDYMEGLVDSGS